MGVGASSIGDLVLVRSLVMILSLVGFAVAIALQFEIPRLANYIFYGLLLWVVLSLFIYRLPGMSRNIGGSAPPRPPPLVSALPPAFGPGSSPPVELGFCAFCGTNIPSGSTLCPACGHSVAPI